MNLINKIVNKETVLYGIFGVLTTIINIGLYQILIINGIKYTDANLFALVVTKIAAYIVNKVFVFNSKTNGILELIKEIGRFIITRGATMALDYFGLILMIEFFGIDKSISKYFITFIVVIINYLLGKKHVFIVKEKESQENV